jgi:hypothetical protein
VAASLAFLFLAVQVVAGTRSGGPPCMQQPRRSGDTPRGYSNRSRRPTNIGYGGGTSDNRQTRHNNNSGGNYCLLERRRRLSQRRRRRPRLSQRKRRRRRLCQRERRRRRLGKRQKRQSQIRQRRARLQFRRTLIWTRRRYSPQSPAAPTKALPTNSSDLAHLADRTKKSCTTTSAADTELKVVIADSFLHHG